MGYLVREIKAEEITRLVEMCESHANYEKTEYSSEGKEKELERLFLDKHPKLFCYVIEVDKNLIGYFSYTFDVSTWDAKTYLHLDCLYLEPEYRGMKIGDIIFEKLLEIAKENQCINIQFQTPLFNEKAIRFYKRIGAIGKEKIRFSLEILD
jgi:ribosomal protein S18 acetylase RimI-like enzyme